VVIKLVYSAVQADKIVVTPVTDCGSIMNVLFIDDDSPHPPLLLIY
jgi:hypothetical protein